MAKAAKDIAGEGKPVHYGFKQTVSYDEAYEKATKKRGILNYLAFSGQPLSKLQFARVEYYILKIKTTSAPVPIDKLRGKDRPVRTKRMNILFNGTTGSVALITDMPELEEIEFYEGDFKQATSYTREDMYKNAAKLAKKLTHRTMGGQHYVEVEEYLPVWRPFWLAFYGDYAVGNKVHYTTIPADGGGFQRAR